MKDITKGRPNTIHQLISGRKRKENALRWRKKNVWVYEVNYCDDKMSNHINRPRRDKSDKRPATLNGFTRVSPLQRDRFSGRRLAKKKHYMLERATALGGVSRKEQLHYYHHPFTIDMIYVRKQKKDIFKMLYETYVDYDSLMLDYSWGFRDVLFTKIINEISYIDEDRRYEIYIDLIQTVFCDLLEYAPTFEDIRFNMYRSYYLYLYRRMLKTISLYVKELKKTEEEHDSEIENECGYMDVYHNYLNIYLNKGFKKILLRRSRF